MYFVIYSLGILLQLCCAVLISYILIVQEQSKEYNAFENISSGNIKYSALTCFYMSFLGLGNGVCTILLGVSVTNPLLIMLGFDPLVRYYLNNSMPWQHLSP